MIKNQKRFGPVELYEQIVDTRIKIQFRETSWT